MGRGRKLAVMLLCAIASLVTAPLVAGADRGEERAAMVEEIERDLATMPASVGIERLSPVVAGALREVPRHAFVPAEYRDAAYENRPLPIGYGQTISQPTIVALMTELLQVEAGDRVFELGTGSGYQAAVLGAMGTQVFSVEIVPELGEEAGERLTRLGYTGVHTRIRDGYFGWPEEAPFDAIVVTAAGDHVPPPLIRQLKPGGRMVIPVGSRYLTQHLLLVERDRDGAVSTREVLPVRFVPLTGGH
jgi:protein-L-isoaspartate(D-aspartate) O-methyltransferase